MIARSQISKVTNCLRALRRRLVSDGASQIVEFALSVPLLVVFSVGIFDFTAAGTLKMKLANAARDCARSVAAAPGMDVGNTIAPAPASVFDGLDVVVNYLDNAKVNDCGLRVAAPTAAGLTYTYTASGNGCPGSGVVLTINRGCVVPTAGTLNIVGTCVQLQYSYQWQFNRVITLLVPGATYAGTTTMTATAMSMNEN